MTKQITHTLSTPVAKVSVFLFMLVVHCVGIFGQPNKANINILNNKSGLAGLEAKWFFIDDQSHIWIETTTGLDQWNGYRFAHHNPPTLPVTNDPYRPPKFEAAAEDADHIYFYYFENPDEYDAFNKHNRTFEQRSFVEQLGSGKHQVKTNPLGNPYALVLEDHQARIHDLFSDTVFTIAPSNHLDKIAEFVPGKDGFWLRDSSFHIVYMPKNGEPVAYPAPENLGRRNGISQVNHVFHETLEGDLWYSIPDYSGLYKQKRGAAEPLLIPNIDEDKNVVNLWMDKKGRTLIALSYKRQVIRDYQISEDGLTFTSWPFISNRSVLGTKIIGEDLYQRIHFGSYQKLEIINFQVPFIQSALTQPTVPGRQYGRIVIGLNPLSEDQLLVTSEDETYTLNTSTGEAEPATIPMEALIERLPTVSWDQTVTVSTLNTTYQFADRITIQYMNGERTKFLDIPMHGADIAQIDDDHMLVIGQNDSTTTLGYILNIRSGQLKKLDSDAYPLLTTSSINHVYTQPGASTVYFCSFNDGLLAAEYKNNTIQPLTKIRALGLPKRNIISLASKRNGDLLVGSFYGLHIYDPKSNEVKKAYSRDNGLSSNIVAATAEDTFGTVWIATYSGLNALYTDDRIGRFYDTDGLPYDEFNRNAVTTMPSGKIYFGSGNGLVIIDPKGFQSYESNFSVLFSSARYRTDETDITIDAIPQKAEPFSINTLNAIDIYVGNNDWGFTEDVTYFYRTAGLDSTWQSTTDQRISVERVPEGKYAIEIKALSRYGGWSTNSVHFPVHVYIPFFSRLWVRFALVFLGLVLLVLYLRDADQRRYRQRVDFQRRVSELELSLLQSQMNPHFIFNALGAIQFYIYNNQGEIAEDYLSKFANLMRMFLESSRLKFISLKDEIKLISSYIELEQMRFPDKFDSTIVEDVEDSTDHYQLPAMMLQPFIENAINHGIFHMKEHGQLTVTFSNTDTHLTCVIDDNGIGRKAAKEIRQASLKPHKSRSTQITEERLEILKEAENMDISFNYYDYDEKRDGRSGTKVSIIIPIIS